MVKNQFNNFKRPMLSSQTPKSYLAHDVENTPNRVSVFNIPHSPLASGTLPTRRPRETAQQRQRIQAARDRNRQKFIQDRQDKRDAQRQVAVAENQRKVGELKRRRKAQADAYEKASFFGLNPTERKIVIGAAIGGAIILTGGLAAGVLDVAAGGVIADELAVPLLAPEIELTELGGGGAVELAEDELAVEEVGTLGQTQEEAAENELNEYVNQSTEQELTAADNDISDQALQREIDEQGINVQVESELPSSSDLVAIGDESGPFSATEKVTLNELNSLARGGNAAKFSRLASQVLAQGTRGAQILAQVSAVATLPAAAISIIQQAKEIQNEKTLSGKIGKLTKLQGTTKQAISVISGKELIQLDGLGHKLNQIGEHINQIEKAGEIINVIANKELQIEKNNNDQLKILIDENKGDAEAQKHGQVLLDNELQKLETEEKKEEDISMRIATAIDRPVSINDFMKDIQSFNSEKAKIDYVVENYSTFISLGQGDINSILDMLNSSNAISVF